MKVILLDNIKGVGKKDEVINASDGYANVFSDIKMLADIAKAELSTSDTEKEINIPVMEDNSMKETSMEENFSPLEKKSSRVEANFQQEDNFQGLENVDNTGVEENFMGKNTSRVENNFQSKLDNINSIVDKIIVGFADIIKNINKLSDLRTTKNLISNQSA